MCPSQVTQSQRGQGQDWDLENGLPTLLPSLSQPFSSQGPRLGFSLEPLPALS